MTDRGLTHGGQYTWMDIGSSYLPSDMLAAFLYAQLEHMDEITSKRQAIYERYYELLKPLASKGAVRLPEISNGDLLN